MISRGFGLAFIDKCLNNLLGSRMVDCACNLAVKVKDRPSSFVPAEILVWLGA